MAALRQNDIMPSATPKSLKDCAPQIGLIDAQKKYDTQPNPTLALQERVQTAFDDYSSEDLKKYPPALTIIGTLTFCTLCWAVVYSLVF